MEFKDYYAILGVPKDASQEDIKRAYRKLARKYHPDVSKEPDAEARFKELNEANEVLKDPEKRAAYDQLGSQWRSGQEFRPPPDWDVGFEFSGGPGGMGDGGFSDFFEALFGAGSPFTGASQRTSRRTREHLRGEDHHARILIRLEDSFHGTQRSIQLQVPEADGRGRIALRTRTLNVRIPRGVAAGQKIRLAGQGAPGFAGGPAGDLYLEIEFEPHPLFQVEGRDLHLTLPLAPWEAALGAQIQVPTPTGGRLEVKIPPGAQSGQKLRLKGRGLPGQPAGDQYVVLKIVNPPIDAKARDLYQRMAREVSFDPRAAWEHYSGAA